MSQKSDVFVGEAPGRLDFMGGVADYSGSLVLEMPIEGKTTVEVRELDTEELHFFSPEYGEVRYSFTEICNQLENNASLDDIRNAIENSLQARWVHYLVGCLVVLHQEKRWQLDRGKGFAFSVKSTVPSGSGVSSSAALEIATLRALAHMKNIDFEGTELACLGQQAENHIVGAPCGLMDQLSSAYGKREALLPILCRPDQLQSLVQIPNALTVVGWPSGVKHSVGDSPYARARTASFMGKKILEELLGKKWNHTTEIDLSTFRENESKVPENVTGKEFSEKWGEVDDALSEIKPDMSYPVRAAVQFPIEENDRANKMVEMLSIGKEEDFIKMGELLYASHEGYGAMGLGCEATDRIVKILKDLGPEKGVYGGRISGGGSGGTVVVLLKKEALSDLEAAAKEYFSAKEVSFIF